MSRMFGTDGVRGVAGTELTIDLAVKLGQAGAYVLTREKAHCTHFLFWQIGVFPHFNRRGCPSAKFVEIFVSSGRNFRFL